MDRKDFNMSSTIVHVLTPRQLQHGMQKYPRRSSKWKSYACYVLAVLGTARLKNNAKIYRERLERARCGQAETIRILLVFETFGKHVSLKKKVINSQMNTKDTVTYDIVVQGLISNEFCSFNYQILDIVDCLKGFEAISQGSRKGGLLGVQAQGSRDFMMFVRFLL